MTTHPMHLDGASVAEAIDDLVANRGNATLVAGTVTVANTLVEAGSHISLMRSVAGGTEGELTVTITAGTHFVITSSNAADTSTVNWLLFV